LKTQVIKSNASDEALLFLCMLSTGNLYSSDTGLFNVLRAGGLIGVAIITQRSNSC